MSPNMTWEPTATHKKKFQGERSNQSLCQISPLYRYTITSIYFVATVVHIFIIVVYRLLLRFV